MSVGQDGEKTSLVGVETSVGGWRGKEIKKKKRET